MMYVYTCSVMAHIKLVTFTLHTYMLIYKYI